MRYSLGPFTGIVLALSSIAPALLNLYVSEWLREWVQEPTHVQTGSHYRNVFVMVVLSFLALTLLRNFVVGSLTLFQNKNLHDHMLRSIVRAKIAFFDDNPTSIILSRFSKDLSVGDITMPVVSTWFSQFFFRVISVFVVLCYVVPWMLFPICLVIFCTLLLRKFLARIMCEAMKLETLTRAPVTGLISTSLSGLVSIRTYSQELFFRQKIEEAIDLNSRAFTTFHIMTRTFTLSLDILSATVIIFSLFTAFFVRTKENVLLLTMAIQMANDLMGTFQTSIRLSSDLQSYMANINRCLQFTRAIPEAPLSTYRKERKERNHKNKYKVAPGRERVEVDEEKAQGPQTGRAKAREDYKVQLIEKQILQQKGSHKTWVMQGMISIRHAMMRYKANSDPAINDLNIKIPGGCKVGIVGRTGSGKSSIINALLRIVELEKFNDGGIKIDHIDISKLGLHALRKNISLIPQTPFLFEGSLRENLDPGVPQSAQNDSRIWGALDEVDLAEYVMALPLRLDTWCGQGNLHFSVGQKQQLCLARALLKKNKIVVMDQATANIDPSTETIMADIINREFVECTVIIVAHRLKTIIEADMVVVMDEGKCVEQGPPFQLLVKNPNDNDITADTLFAGLVNEQVSQREILFEKAREAYFRKHISI